MAYLPKSKYSVKYTNGNEFIIAGTQESYKGPYLRLFDGRLYIGDSIQNIGKQLTPLRGPQYKNIRYDSVNNRTYSILQSKKTHKEQGEYLPIPSSSPLPTVVDYSKGFYMRFFVVRLNTVKYTEISRDTYDNFNSRHNKVLYQPFFLKWALGADSEEKNSQTINRIKTSLPNFENYFPDLTQYQIQNGYIAMGPIKRIYPDGEVVPEELPRAYQTGNRQTNTITNKKVPAGEHCGNCFFAKNNYCERWKANVRNSFWCKAYENKATVNILPPEPIAKPTVSRKTTVARTTENSTPNTPSTSRRGGY